MFSVHLILLSISSVQEAEGTTESNLLSQRPSMIHHSQTSGHTLCIGQQAVINHKAHDNQRYKRFGSNKLDILF